MNSERFLTPIEKLARRRAAVRARRLKSRSVRVPLTGAERLSRRRALMRARGAPLSTALCAVDWEPFANDEEALDFIEEMTAFVLASELSEGPG